MKRLIIVAWALCSTVAVAQHQDNNRAYILSEVEKNNTTLKALRQKGETDKVMNKVGTALPDPTFGFSYSWGNKTGMEGKKTFSAEQELDMGTLSGQRSKTAKSNNAVIDWNYQIERQRILSEAEQLLIQLTYHNAMCGEMSARMERAANLKNIYEKKMLAGDANQLEINKIKLFYTAAAAEYKKVQAQRQITQDHLKRLNGNQPVNYGYDRFDEIVLPSLLKLEKDAMTLAPQIQLANATINTEKAELKLNKIEGLPRLSVGYTGEHVGGNNYNGISVGVSIPVWGNSRKKVSQQRSSILAAELEKQDVESQLLSMLRLQYTNTNNLFQIAKEFRAQLTDNEDTILLDKALAAGQISLIDYLNEISFYDNARTQALEIERDCHIALSQMLSIFR